MPGIGVLANVIAVIVGTIVGLAFGGLIPERMRDTSFKAIGLSTFIIGIGMSTTGLLALGKEDGALGKYSALVFVGSLVIGALVGEALRIEYWLERFGHWLQTTAQRMPFLAPTPSIDEPNAKGHTLVEGFVTASLLYCVGAMTVLGSIQDGLGDPSTLYLKATLDGLASVALASTLGWGVGLSVIPIFILQGGIALGANSAQTLMTPAVIAAIQAAGGALILAIGLDLMGVKRLPVGNMLPAVFIAALFGVWLG